MIDLISGDCLRRMKEIVDGSVDLTVTSPRAYWDGIGLPPVGADQNVFVPATRISAAGSDSPRSTWKVVAHHNGHAVVCIDEFGTGQHGAHIIPASGCRPLRTQAKLERDEVVAAAEYTETASQAFALLYDAGMLRRTTWSNHLTLRRWVVQSQKP